MTRPSIKLGEGTYGTVRLENGTAVKTFHKLPRLVQEYAALVYLKDCPHIVKPLKVKYKKNELVMELYDTSFRKWLDSGGLFNYKGTMLIIRDILLGLIELHDRGLAHGDIKPGNILVNENPLRAVLGDAGFVSVQKYAKVKRTAPTYRDPNEHFSTAHDIYSLGIILVEIFGKIKLLRQHEYKEIWKIAKEHLDDDECEIVLEMLNDKHSKRPSAREVLDRLFNMRVPEYSTSDITITPRISDTDLQKMRTRIMKTCDDFKISRGNIGFYALVAYFSNSDSSMSSDSDKSHPFSSSLHEVIILMILTALFGGPRIDIPDAKRLSNRREDEIYKLLKQMTSNIEVMQILFGGRNLFAIK